MFVLYMKKNSGHFWNTLDRGSEGVETEWEYENVDIRRSVEGKLVNSETV